MAASVSSPDAGLAAFEIALFVAAAVSAGLFCAYDAKRNGRRPALWFLVGLVPVVGVAIWLIARGPRPVAPGAATAPPTLAGGACPTCGSLQAPQYGFCPACGAERSGSVPADVVAPLPVAALPAGRPIGVALLAGWQLLQGVAYLALGAVVLRLGPGALASAGLDPASYAGVEDALAPALVGFGALLVLWGALLLRGPRWAWPLTVGAECVILAFSLVTALASPASLLSAASAGLILWYLYRPHVRAWFSRGRAPSVP